MGIIFGRPWYPFMPVVYTRPQMIVERPIIVEEMGSPLSSPTEFMGSANMGSPNIGMPNMGSNGGKRKKTKKISRRKRRLNSRKN
jgi:hypothetical protein